MNQTLGRETTLEIGGKNYTLARFDRTIADKFLDYVRKNRPNPIEMVREQIKGFPPELQNRMIDNAMAKASQRLSYDSPEYVELLKTPEGSYHLLTLLFQKHQPGTTEKQVITLYDAAIEEHGMGYIEEKIQQAEGVMPVDDKDVKRQNLQAMGVIEPDAKKK